MSDLLARIDAATAGLCPCGAEPRAGSAHCGPDCEPTHISDDTEAPDCETARPGEDYFDPRYAPPTPMRWRPDLVSAADDTDLIPLGSETHGYTGRYNAQVYERASDPTIWHLRLDDGNLFVGCDLRDVGGRQDPIRVELVGRVREAWQRLERKLTDTRDMIPDEDDDPWADVMGRRDPVRDLLEEARARRRHFGPEIPAWLRAADPQAVQVCRSYHNPPQAVDVSADRLASFARTAVQSMQPLIEAMDAFARQSGVLLTEWQRHTVERMYTPHLVVLAVERVEVAGYRPAADPDEPPTDPMERALWLRKRRNTGPQSDRLDGRRRQRR